MSSEQVQRIATLWQLAWQENRLTCAIYRDSRGQMELRIESATAVIVTEKFEVQPRALTRAHALRDSLKRRGWEEAHPGPLPPTGTTDAPSRS